MVRKLSPAAEVARLLKQLAKKLDLKVSARSKNYSMGDHVSVDVHSGLDQNLKQFRDQASIYKYGHFNGMEDIYVSSNSRDDIPQTKFLFIQDNRPDGRLGNG